MIDFSPLQQTLADKKMVISDLRDKVLNSRTISRINKNESVSLITIDKICMVLDVPIEKVVRIIKQ